MAKADCAVDKLIDTGASAAVGMLKNLGKTVLNAYIPVLADLLFAKDGSAAQTRAILNAIDSAKTDVIYAMVGEVYDETLGVDRPWIREKVDTYSLSPFSISLGMYQAGCYANLEEKMDLRRIRLQQREKVFGLEALHTLTMLVDMHLPMKPSVSYWGALTGRGVTVSAMRISPAEVGEMQSEVRFATELQINSVLTGDQGSLRYFHRLDSENRYR